MLTVILLLRNINELCKKGNQKPYALAQCAKYMSDEKRRTFFKAFVVSQFNYCPLMWMFHTSLKVKFRTEIRLSMNY